MDSLIIEHRKSILVIFNIWVLQIVKFKSLEINEIGEISEKRNYKTLKGDLK